MSIVYAALHRGLPLAARRAAGESNRSPSSTGANGSGKSEPLSCAAAAGRRCAGPHRSVVALEGGISSVLWAGPEQFSRGMKARRAGGVQGTVRKAPISLKSRLLVRVVWLRDRPRPAGPRRPFRTRSGDQGGVAVDRPRPATRQRLRRTKRSVSHLARPHRPAPAGATHTCSVRQHVDPLRQSRGCAPRCCRCASSFATGASYDHFRTDIDAPARRRQVGTRTPVLAGDGRRSRGRPWPPSGDRHRGRAGRRRGRCLSRRLGSNVAVSDGYFEVEMLQHGLLRPLKATELSDGTLRYLLLVAALLSPRPPSLMILNEPRPAASRPAVAARAPHRGRREAIADHCGIACRAPRLGADEGRRTPHHAGEGTWRDGCEGEERPMWNWPARQ